MTTLIFVRHGQSMANLQQVFAGHYDIPLTELGHAQAEKTAEYLDRYPIDCIYSSDLIRARQTAEHTAARRGMPIVNDEVFREIFAGEWEGMPFEEIKERYEDSHLVWCKQITRSRPNGGESVQELSKRIWQGVQSVLETHRGQTVAIFTHATPVRTLSWRWKGYDIHSGDPEQLDRADEVVFCPNASVSVAEYDDADRLISYTYGYAEHLKDLSTELPRGLV